jgi:nucleoid-associated protein YgaU
MTTHGFTVETRRYVVAPGDTLWDISRRELGDAMRYKEVAALSHLSNPDVIHAGDVLTLKRQVRRIW